MPDTIRERAIVAFEDLFDGVSGLNFRSRNFYDTLAEAELPSLIIFDGAEETLDSPAGILFIRQGMAVEVRFRATSPQQCGPLASEWYGKVVAAAGANPTLSGLVHVVRFEGADEPSYASGSGPSFGRLIVGFSITRQDKQFDPYSTQ
jgi:hypothetical protein